MITKLFSNPNHSTVVDHTTNHIKLQDDVDQVDDSNTIDNINEFDRRSIAHHVILIGIVACLIVLFTTLVLIYL